MGREECLHVVHINIFKNETNNEFEIYILSHIYEKKLHGFHGGNKQFYQYYILFHRILQNGFSGQKKNNFSRFLRDSYDSQLICFFF